MEKHLEINWNTTFIIIQFYCPVGVRCRGINLIILYLFIFRFRSTGLLITSHLYHSVIPSSRPCQKHPCSLCEVCGHMDSVPDITWIGTLIITTYGTVVHVVSHPTDVLYYIVHHVVALYQAVVV